MNAKLIKTMDDILGVVADNDLSWDEMFKLFQDIPNNNIHDFIGYMRYERYKRK